MYGNNCENACSPNSTGSCPTLTVVYGQPQNYQPQRHTCSCANSPNYTNWYYLSGGTVCNWQSGVTVTPDINQTRTTHCQTWMSNQWYANAEDEAIGKKTTYKLTNNCVATINIQCKVLWKDGFKEQNTLASETKYLAAGEEVTFDPELMFDPGTEALRGTCIASSISEVTITSSISGLTYRSTCNIGEVCKLSNFPGFVSWIGQKLKLKMTPDRATDTVTFQFTNSYRDSSHSPVKSAIITWVFSICKRDGLKLSGLTIPDQVIFVGYAAVEVPITGVYNSPQECESIGTNFYSVTVTPANGNFTFNSQTGKISLRETQNGKFGVYTVTITATNTQLGITNSQASFKVTVKCTRVASWLVTQVDNSVTLVMGTDPANYTINGAVEFTLTPSYPSAEYPEGACQAQRLKASVWHLQPDNTWIEASSFAPAGAPNTGGITNMPKYVSFDNLNVLTLSNALGAQEVVLKVHFQLFNDDGTPVPNTATKKTIINLSPCKAISQINLVKTDMILFITGQAQQHDIPITASTTPTSCHGTLNWTIISITPANSQISLDVNKIKFTETDNTKYGLHVVKMKALNLTTQVQATIEFNLRVKCTLDVGSMDSITEKTINVINGVAPYETEYTLDVSSFAQPLLSSPQDACENIWYKLEIRRSFDNYSTLYSGIYPNNGNLTNVNRFKSWPSPWKVIFDTANDPSVASMYNVQFVYGKESANNAEFQRSRTQTIIFDVCKKAVLVTSESIANQVVYMNTMVSITPPTYAYQQPYSYTNCSGSYVFLFTSASTPAFDLSKIAYNSTTGKIEILENVNSKNGVFQVALQAKNTETTATSVLLSFQVTVKCTPTFEWKAGYSKADQKIVKTILMAQNPTDNPISISIKDQFTVTSIGICQTISWSSQVKVYESNTLSFQGSGSQINSTNVTKFVSLTDDNQTINLKNEWPTTEQTLQVQFRASLEASPNNVQRESVVFEVIYLPCPYNEIQVLNLQDVQPDSQIRIPANAETKYQINLTSKYASCPLGTTLACLDSSQNTVSDFTTTVNGTAQGVFTIGNNIKLEGKILDCQLKSWDLKVDTISKTFSFKVQIYYQCKDVILESVTTPNNPASCYIGDPQGITLNFDKIYAQQQTTLLSLSDCTAIKYAIQFQDPATDSMTTLTDANLASQFLIKKEQFTTVANYALDYFIVQTSKPEYAGKTYSFTIELAVNNGNSALEIKKKSQVRQVTFIDKCNEATLNDDPTTTEKWGSIKIIDLTVAQKAFVGFSQVWKRNKPGVVVPVGYSFITCAYQMVPKNVEDELLISQNKIKLTLGANIEIAQQFAAGDGKKHITFGLYVSNLNGGKVLETEVLYTIKFDVVDDICTTYTIAQDSSGSTAGSISTERQTLVVNQIFKLLLDNFSFQAHAIDTNNACQLTYMWTWQNGNQMNENNFSFQTETQEGNVYQYAVLKYGEQASYPEHKSPIIVVSLKSQNGSLIVATQKQRQFYVTILFEYCQSYTIKETKEQLEQLNPYFAQDHGIKKYYAYRQSFVSATYEKSPLDNISKCTITNELIVSELNTTTPIQNLNNQASITDNFLNIRWQGFQQQVTLTLKAALKTSKGEIVHELAISTNLTIIDICPTENDLSMVIDGDISLSNAIRASNVSKKMPQINDLITETFGKDNNMTEICGPIKFQLFQQRGETLEALYNNYNEYLSLTDENTFDLQTSDPKWTTERTEFTLVVYKSEYYDIKKYPVGLNKSVGFTKKVLVRLSNCIIKELKWPVVAIDINFIQGSDPVSVTHSPLRDGNFCNYPISFSLLYDSNNLIKSDTNLKAFNFQELTFVPEFVAYDSESQKITITSKKGIEGQFKLYTVAQISSKYQVPEFQTALPIIVTISARAVSVMNSAPYFPKQLTSMTLETGKDGVLMVPLTEAKDDENQAITHKVELPTGASFLKWDNDQIAILIDGKSAMEAKASGVYVYNVKLKDSMGAESVFNGRIEFMTPKTEDEPKTETQEEVKPEPPKLSTSIPDVVMTPGKNKKIYLPPLAKSATAVSETVNLKGEPWMSYDSVSRSIFIDGKEATQTGKYSIEISLRDENDLTSTSTIYIDIVKPSDFKGVQIKQQSGEYDVIKRELLAKVKDISANGEVRVQFSENIIPFETKQMEEVCAALKIDAYSFSELSQMYELPIKMTHECTKLNKDELQMKLKFDQPQQISTTDKPDRLFIEFINELKFRSEKEFILIEPFYKIQGLIPAQFSSPGEAQLLQASANATQGGSYLIIIALIVGQLAGKSIIKRIWSLFMSLQLASLMLNYESIQMPAIAKNTLQNINGVIILDALNPKKLLQRFVPKAYAYLSNPQHFLSKLDPIILLAAGLVATGVLVAFVSIVLIKIKQNPNGKIMKGIQKVKAMLLYNPMIASIQTSYLGLVVTSSTQFKDSINGFRNRVAKPALRALQSITEVTKEPPSLKSLIQDSVQGFIMCAALISVIAGFGRLIQSKPQMYFKKEETQKKIGALYSTLSLKTKVQMHYATFFFARRFFVGVVCVTVDTIALKVELITLSCYIAIYYCIMYSPFKDRGDNILEIINEVFLVISNYWCVAFSDLFWDTSAKKIQQGWVYMQLLIVMIGINFIYLVKRTLVVAIFKWLDKRKRRKLALQRQEQQQRSIVEASERGLVQPQIEEKQIEQQIENIPQDDRTTYVDLSQLVNIPDEVDLLRPDQRVTIIDTSKVQGVIVISDEDSDELKFEGRTEQFNAQKYFSRLFPFKAQLQLRQGDRQQFEGYQLFYLMPKSDEWQLKAALAKTVKVPSYANDSSTRQQLVLDECKYHWFYPEEAQKLADRLEIISQGQHRFDRLVDKRLIWIIEAAKQRRLEYLQQKLILIEDRYTTELNERKALRTKMKHNIDKQIEILKRSKAYMADLQIPSDISEDQLRELFAVECFKRKIEPDRTRRLLTHFKYRMKPGNLKSETDHLVADILSDIRIADGARAITEGYDTEIKNLKKQWEQEDLEHFADVKRIQQAIDDIGII